MRGARLGATCAALLCALAATRTAGAQARKDSIAPDAAHAPVVAALTTAIAHAMRDQELPALSIAIVDGDRIVWATGFGVVDSVHHTPATAATVYRVGEVSSLITAIGIMQLAEQHRVDLDAPAERILPDFHPANPFRSPITIRELASHRSGLVREPPTGGYADSTVPSLASTVRSLDSTGLVISPGTRIKQSNAGIATLGAIVERVTHQPFGTYAEQHVLAPLGMDASAFDPAPALASQTYTGTLWTYDGRRFTAPQFPLGESPAMGLRTTVMDLGRFMTAMFAGGRGPGASVLDARTLASMWRPIGAATATGERYGLGFRTETLDGMRELGASGSIYGVSTELHMLPDRKVGVVVITALDGTNGISARLATMALRALVAAQHHAPMPAWAETTPVPPRSASRLEGRYASADSSVELRYLTAPSDSDSAAAQLAERSDAGGTRATLRMRGDTLMRDDRFAFGTHFMVRGDTLVASTRRLARVRDSRPADAPPKLARLVGEYGWDHDILYIVERRGRIEALTDWFYRAPLERVSDSTYRFPAGSRYDSEPVTFAFDSAGAVIGVRVGWRWFPRRAIGPASGNQLRVTPVRPIADLEREARAAQPPHEAPHPRRTDLVELVKLDSTIHLEIRYATTNNFLGTKFYPQARAFLQRPAAEALVRAHRHLETMGYGILIHDSYRPWYVTKMFWDAVPEDKKIFVADPAQGSRHNRGAAADITLYDLATGKPVEMVSTYDETSDRAWANYPGGTSLQRWLRALLRHAMEAEGFTVYHAEWWHFDYRGFNEYPIGNIPYDQISGDTTARPAP